MDPIDGTRGLMYDKRSAWILTGIAELRGRRGQPARLSDIEVAVQTEVPTTKQGLLRWVDGLDIPVLNSRIAHVRAASPLGARYDETMTDEDRRAFANLILLCLPHAEEVDLAALADRYLVQILQQWKVIQLQAAPAEPPILPQVVLERAVFLSMGDVVMDFRGAAIDLGGTVERRPGTPEFGEEVLAAGRGLRR